MAGAIIVAVVIVLSGGGGGSSGPAAAETPTTQALAAAASATQAPTQAPAPTSTPVPPSPVPPTAVPQLPDRTNCNDIRGTDYRSASEEAFFRANCAGTGAPAPTARPVTGAPPPPAPAQANNVEAEARYRNQAAAQLAYFSAQIRQQVDATGGVDGQAAILQISSLLTNFINALDSLQPVPPRFQGVHNALRATLVDFRTQVQIGLTIKTSAQLLAWVPKMFAAADNADHAISDFNIVVGTKVPGLR